MNRTILVRGARQLLTLHGPTGARRGEAASEIGLIDDGSVLIVNGAIAAVGPTRRVENLADAKRADEVNAQGRVVMPAWVDCHTVLAPLPLRALDFPSAEELSRVRGPAFYDLADHYLRTTSPSRLEFQARKTIEAAIRHGTVSLESKIGFSPSEPTTVKSLKVIRALENACSHLVQCFVAAGFGMQFGGREDDYIEFLCRDLMPKLHSRGLSETAEIACDPGRFTLAQARTFVVAARRLGFDAKVHSENLPESGAASLAVEGHIHVISGLTQCAPADAELIARSGSIAALLPGGPSQASGLLFPPARLLIDSGVPVALGSGRDGYLPSPVTMQAAVVAACNHMGMTVEEAITGATINGAHAIHRAHATGSLEFGKSGDLVVLGVSDYRELPYTVGANLVELTMQRGAIVYREGAVNCEPA